METVGLLSAGVLAVGVAAVGLVSELPVLTFGDQRSLAVTEAIVRGDLEGGYSFYGQKRLMAACMQGMTGIWQSLAVAEQREAHAGNCLGYALSYTSVTPVDSLSWTVAARASFYLSDQEAMNRYLSYAWNSGRNEQWVAGLRVSLAEDAWNILSEVNQKNHKIDLGLMVISRSGIAAIADRYWSDGKFRERITEVVEGLPVGDQRRFISSVRRAAVN